METDIFTSSLSGLRRPNLMETVSSVIRMLIFSGQLKPGQKIDQDGIAEQLGVSKHPIREALISIEAEGLIENIARRGAFVAHLTRQDIRDHFEIYGLVSALATRQAVDVLSSENFQRLHEIINEMENIEDPHEQEKLNFQFHRIIHQAGSSRRLKSALRFFYQSIPIRFYEFTSGWIDVANRDHREIIACLENRDAYGASQATVQHLMNSGKFAVDILEKSGFWSNGIHDNPA